MPPLHGSVDELCTSDAHPDIESEPAATKQPNAPNTLSPSHFRYCIEQLIMHNSTRQKLLALLNMNPRRGAIPVLAGERSPAIAGLYMS